MYIVIPSGGEVNVDGEPCISTFGSYISYCVEILWHHLKSGCEPSLFMHIVNEVILAIINPTEAQYNFIYQLDEEKLQVVIVK